MTLTRIKHKSDKADQGKRSPAHRAWIRGWHCTVPGCMDMPIECAHVRSGSDGGLGMKPGDQFCVSLCRAHHSEQHTIGEKSFEVKYGVDLLKTAEMLYRRSPHRGKLTDPFGG